MAEMPRLNLWRPLALVFAVAIFCTWFACGLQNARQRALMQDAQRQREAVEVSETITCGWFAYSIEDSDVPRLRKVIRPSSP